MQTRTGVEYSSLTCLVRYGLFYRCEKLINWIRCICTCGGRCVVGWCLDNPCGGSITGSCSSQSSYQYQCGAILSADVCLDAVHRFSVGRKPRLCTCVLYNSEGYKLHYLYRGMIGTYVYGLSSGLQGPSGVSGCFLLCNASPTGIYLQNCVLRTSLALSVI